MKKFNIENIYDIKTEVSEMAFEFVKKDNISGFKPCIVARLFDTGKYEVMQIDKNYVTIYDNGMKYIDIISSDNLYSLKQSIVNETDECIKDYLENEVINDLGTDINNKIKSQIDSNIEQYNYNDEYLKIVTEQYADWYDKKYNEFMENTYNGIDLDDFSTIHYDEENIKEFLTLMCEILPSSKVGDG